MMFDAEFVEGFCIKALIKCAFYKNHRTICGTVKQETSRIEPVCQHKASADLWAEPRVHTCRLFGKVRTVCMHLSVSLYE